MSELIEGLSLMLKGMGIVFLFLIILVIMMKLIPILSKRRYESPRAQEPVIAVQRPERSTAPKMAQPVSDRDRARAVAAIAAAITATMGKAPKKLVVTTPEGDITKYYDSWSYVGRHDLMEVGNLQGQRSFQY